MALEMSTHFNTWCLKILQKNKSGPEQKLGAPQFVKTRGPNGPGNFGLFGPGWNAGVHIETYYGIVSFLKMGSSLLNVGPPVHQIIVRTQSKHF